MNAAALLLALAGASQNVQPIESQTPPVYAVRTTTPIVVDGLLSEEVWATAPAVTTFTQRDPTEGAAPSEKTEVRIAYDDEAIYVGARLLDSQPRTIVGRLGRRDSNLGADELTFYVDPYHDGRSGYYFAVNAAGTLPTTTGTTTAGTASGRGARTWTARAGRWRCASRTRSSASAARTAMLGA